MRALAAVLVLAVLANSAHGHTHEDARRLFLAGSQAFNEGRLDVAASSFEAAYRLEPLPGLLWNLGQTYQRKFMVDGETASLRRAIDAYRHYLAASPNGVNRDEATRLLTDLVMMLGRVAPDQLGAAPLPPPPPPLRTEVMVVTEAPAAAVSLDGAAAVPAPLLATVGAGEHRAEVSAPGYFPAEIKVTAVEGRLVVGEARLQARPAELHVGGRHGEVDVDGKLVGHAPLTLALDAGSHTVAVRARGHQPWVQTLELARGTRLEVAPSLPTTTRRRAALWLLGTSCVVGAGTVAAAALWGQADASAHELLDLQRDKQLTVEQLAQYERDRARRDTWRTGTIVGIGLTVAAGALTATLFAVDTPR
jgi:hypothetical protein